MAVHTAIGAAANSIGVGKFLLSSFHASNSLSMTSSYSSSSRPARILQISSVCGNAVNAVAAPPLRLNICRVPSRCPLRRKRRTKHGLSGNDSENFGDEGFFDCGGGPIDDGGFGGSSGDDRFGEVGDDGDEWSSSSYPVFLFVYLVVSWIMLLECLQFAFKKILRWAAKGIVGAAIDKVSRKLAPNICFTV